MDARKLAGFLFLLSITGTALAQVNCTTAGRFPDPNDTTCQNYTLCALDATTNTYVGYNYVCPTTSVFNPTTAQCTTAYVCPANTTAVTPVATSTCTADGFVADPNVTDCSSYIICVNVSGTFSETPVTCPNGTFYNPTSTLCEPTYVCPTVTTAFNCTTAGRFADATDTTCQNYFFCVADTAGAYIQYNYTCPTTSVFNPTTSVCTTTYTCPTA